MTMYRSPIDTAPLEGFEPSAHIDLLRHTLSSEAPPQERRVFVNRTLRMEKIAYVGFDLDWTLADSLALHMASWTTRGGEIELDWRIHEQFELAASVGYRREQYRLNERTDGAIPPALPTPTAISEGLAEDRAYTTALRASWMPRCRFVQNVFGDLRIDLDVAVALAGRLEVRDENDALLTEQSYDAAPSLGLTFRVPL